MTKIMCKKCDYRFTAEFLPKLCPNCGEESSIVEEKSADDIINEL